jgi:hypothetical protein
MKYLQPATSPNHAASEVKDLHPTAHTHTYSYTKLPLLLIGPKNWQPKPTHQNAIC